jgi:hypothetical protein
MELKEFVSKSIEDVVNGLDDAKGQMKETNAIVNPGGAFKTVEGLVTFRRHEDWGEILLQIPSEICLLNWIPQSCPPDSTRQTE